MEELRMLVEAVAGLPTLAVWVLMGYLVFKMSIVASVYVTIRFCIGRICDYLTERKRLDGLPKEVINKVDIDGICIDGTKESLKLQLRRVAGKRTGISSTYIHTQSVEWLADAISEKEIRDSEKKVKLTTSV
jgi:hypothetical protein